MARGSGQLELAAPQLAQPSLLSVAHLTCPVEDRPSNAGESVWFGLLLHVSVRACVHVCALLGRADQVQENPTPESPSVKDTLPPDISLLQESRTPSLRRHGVCFLLFMFLTFAGIVVYYEWCTWPLLSAQIMNPPAGSFLLTSWHSLKSLLDVELHFAWWLFCALGYWLYCP